MPLARGTTRPVESRRLEDRIRELCTKAVATSDPTEFDAVMQHLREALREHAKRLGQLAAAKLGQQPIAKHLRPERRKAS